MRVNRKIFILFVILIFIFSVGTYFAYEYQNMDNVNANYNFGNKTDEVGCCSVLLQLEGNNTMLSYRRDANLTADIYIENVVWHGIPAIKQYKKDGELFTHVIITDDGWFISMGGIDDGEGNQMCENISAQMVNDNNAISEDYLKQIQAIKQPYKKGHFLIKAPNGNYGYATVDMVETGKLNPGDYISLPNSYSYYRTGTIPINSTDKIKSMIELALSDGYGINRRGIFTYNFVENDTKVFTDIYISNDDGSYFDVNYKDCIDNVYYNNTMTSGEDIPVGPGYKYLGTYVFKDEQSSGFDFMFIIGFMVVAVVIAVLFFIVLRFVQSMRYRF